MMLQTPAVRSMRCSVTSSNFDDDVANLSDDVASLNDDVANLNDDVANVSGDIGQLQRWRRRYQQLPSSTSSAELQTLTVRLATSTLAYIGFPSDVRNLTGEVSIQATTDGPCYPTHSRPNASDDRHLSREYEVWKAVPRHLSLRQNLHSVGYGDSGDQQRKNPTANDEG
jgi:hypothetical protein